jgi:hypothetical protein
LAMRPNGALHVVTEDGSRTAELSLGEGAFDSLVARTGIGGAAYLKSCWPELRAINVNMWLTKIAAEEVAAQVAWSDTKRGTEPTPSEIVLRCRTTDNAVRSVYAVVSKTYRAMDCDVIARALKTAAPEKSRGSVVYDGQQARFEVLFHSDVAADDYGCGEIFRAGIVVRSNDVGDGSIRVSAVVERNLCLNLIVLDTSEQRIAGIRHVGSELASKFNVAIKSALAKVMTFAESWGYARHDSVSIAAGLAADENLSQRSAREVLAGIVWAQTKRDLVPVRGRKPDVVRQVLRAYDVEPAKSGVLSRADVVNAWTRYAHETAAQSDVWIEDDIQTAAGRILQSRKPLPYEAPTFEF